MTASSTPVIATAGGAPQTAMNFGIITITENGRQVQKRVMVTLFGRDGEVVAPPANYPTRENFQTRATQINGLITQLIGEHTQSDDLRDLYRTRIITGLDSDGVNSSEGQTLYANDAERGRWTEISNRILGIFNRTLGDDSMTRRNLFGGIGGGGMPSAQSDNRPDSQDDDELLRLSPRSSPVMSVASATKGLPRSHRRISDSSLSDGEDGGPPPSLPTKGRQHRVDRVRVTTLPEGNRLSAERWVVPQQTGDGASSMTPKFQSRGVPGSASAMSEVGEEEDTDAAREQELDSFKTNPKTCKFRPRDTAPVGAFITLVPVPDSVEGEKAQQTPISEQNRAILVAAIEQALAEAEAEAVKTGDSTRTTQLTALCNSLDKVFLEEVPILFKQYGITEPHLIQEI